MLSFLPLWILYALLLVFIARYSRSRDALLPGKVNVAIQALAYAANISPQSRWWDSAALLHIRPVMF